MAQAKILILENDDDLRDFLCCYMDNLGLQTDSVKTVVEAKKYIVQSELEYTGLIVGYQNTAESQEFVEIIAQDISVLLLVFEISDQDKERFENLENMTMAIKPVTQIQVFDDFGSQLQSRNRLRIKPTYKPLPRRMYDRYKESNITFYAKSGNNDFAAIDDKPAAEANIYLKSHDSKEFFSFVLETINKIYLRKSTPPMQLHQISLEYVHMKLKVIGLKDSDIELVSGQIENSVKQIFKTSELKNTLIQLIQLDDRCYKLALLTAHFSALLAKEVAWELSSKSSMFILAAMFQDVSLDHEDEIIIESIDEHVEEELDIYAINRVKEHPFKSARLLVGHELITDEVLELIKSHHERPGGHGFPNGTDINMHSIPLKIFSLSNHLAYYMLNAKESDLSSTDLMSYVQKTYTLSNNRKILSSLSILLERNLRAG